MEDEWFMPNTEMRRLVLLSNSHKLVIDIDASNWYRLEYNRLSKSYLVHFISWCDSIVAYSSVGVGVLLEERKKDDW